MSTTRSLFLLTLVTTSLLTSAALAQDAGPPVDAGAPPVDAGEPPVDAGEPPVDAGEPPVDAGEPPPVDAGEPPVDAGDPPPPEDAGEPPPPEDAGEPPPPEDAGEPPPPEDAGEPPVCNPGCQDAVTLIACGGAGPVEIPCSDGFICQVDACVLGSVSDGGINPNVDGGATGDDGGRPGPDACVPTCLDDRRLGVCSASGQVTPVPCATNESCNNDGCFTVAEDGLNALACNCGSSGTEGVTWWLVGLSSLAFWRRRRIIARRLGAGS
jgi:MYXO-CTERM domain-containing protein